jgi:NADH dehydrogenase
VNGGTGFIGRAAAAALAGAGHEVRALSRRAAGATAPGIALIRGDVFDPASLAAPLEGCEAVVHCVQFPNHPVENPRRGFTYERYDAEGTENAAAAAVRAGARRFLYLSGAGVRAGRTEPWFRAKWRAEEAVRASGLEWTILRPSWVYGPGDRSLSRFVSFARRLPFMPMIGDGRGRVQPLHVDDLARVAAAALGHPRAPGRVFDAGGPETLTMREILGTILRVLGLGKPILPQPVWAVKGAARLLRLLPAPPLSPDAVDFILQENLVDTRDMTEILGVRARTLDEGLRGLSG